MEEVVDESVRSVRTGDKRSALFFKVTSKTIANPCRHSTRTVTRDGGRILGIRSASIACR